MIISTVGTGWGPGASEFGSALGAGGYNRPTPTIRLLFYYISRIRWYRDAEGAHLAVCDTGIGIPAHHIPRLSERFYRVDQGRSRDSGGTGLGLAIVKHVLKRHRAQLYIESALGKGSLFRCDFPPELTVTEEPAVDLSHGG